VVPLSFVAVTVVPDRDHLAWKPPSHRLVTESRTVHADVAPCAVTTGTVTAARATAPVAAKSTERGGCRIERLLADQARPDGRVD
jgi:hypothetical protein